MAQVAPDDAPVTVTASLRPESLEVRQEPADPFPTQPPPASTKPENPSARVQVRLMGRPAVLDAAGNPVPGLRRHALQLLLYLALYPEGARINAIKDIIWPDATVSAATARMSTEVSNLRRTVRRAAGA
ncbi:hypothetical protein KIH74_35670, partial [Kineosporia sp. J2-2]